jgi:lysyl-tRNA synthetase class 2
MKRFEVLKNSIEMQEMLRQKARIFSFIREFFDTQGFIEVDTPLLVKSPGMEPYLDPMGVDTHTPHGDKHQGYLITSPEYSMKKLLAGGMDKIYQMNKCFRDFECWDGSHNPEFMMIEWYRQNADYTDIIKDVCELVRFCNQKLYNTDVLSYQGKDIDLSTPEVLSVHDALLRYAEVRLAEVSSVAGIRCILDKKGYSYTDDEPWDDLFFKLFLNDVEPKLGVDRLTVLKDYPLPLAALARKKEELSDGVEVAERFEAYCGGLELCNGFGELTDPDEQLHRLEEERALRQELGKVDYPIDKDFIHALQLGISESGGVALGVDRLIMLLLDKKDIRDTLIFPMEDLMNE